MKTLLFVAVLLLGTSASGIERIPYPYETGNLRAFVNMTEGATLPAYKQNVTGFRLLITDISYFAAATDGKPWAPDIHNAKELAAWVSRRTQRPIIGRYHSSRFCAAKDMTLEQFRKGAEESVQRVPFEHYVPQESFSEAELLPVQYNHPNGMRTVDFRKPAARQKLVDSIVRQARRRGATLLMTDEWCPAAKWDGTDWTAGVIAYEKQLTGALHQYGILHCPNMHFRVGGANDFDGSNAPRLTARQLFEIAENCDLMLLERSCDAEASPQQLLEDYTTISSTATPCVLLGPSIDSEDFVVGIALLTATNSGVCNYLGWPVNARNAKWQTLPARLGPPTSPVTWNGHLATRRFRFGKVTVDFNKRAATFTGRSG
jgi:hypothetical protein